MLDTSQNPKKSISALLSAYKIAAGDNGDNLSADLVLGQPIIARQIAQLMEFGITHFIVAIDNMPGMLLALADQLTEKGIRVDFVRSPQELSEKLSDTDFIFVQEEGVIGDNQLINECLSVSSPYIATLDGREENRAFENIDLNTVWAGLALLPVELVQGIGALPQDWSISSTLLRQGVTQNVHRRPIPQALLQTGALQLLQSNDDAGAFSKSLLSNYNAGQYGWIEQAIFAPISKMILPRIMRSPSISRLLDFGPASLALGSLVLAASSQNIFAIAIGLIALFMLTMRDIATIYNPLSQQQKWVAPLCYGLLALAAAAGIARIEFIDERFGVVAIVVAGIIAASNYIDLPNWASKLLRSPALFAMALLMGVMIFGPVWTVLVFAVVQIAILLFALRK
jgi:hypothetical protein